MDFNYSDWTERLIGTLATFSVEVPSQNPYKLKEISSETPRTTLQKNPKTSTFLKTDLLSENSFFKSRPHMAALADPQSGKYSYIDHLFHTFCKNTISTINKLSFTRCFALNPSLS